jgi:hypothetical protein
MKSLNPHVIAQVERRCVHPQWPAKAARWYVEDLTEPGEEVQPALDRTLCVLDPKAAIGVEEAAAIQNAQSTDVLRPNLIRPKDKAVFCAQPLH